MVDFEYFNKEGDGEMEYAVDLEKIAEELDFDLEDVEMLLEVFLEGAKENLQVLKTAIDSGDMETTFKTAHAIKGSAANLTLKEISEIAKDIELNARKECAIDYQDRYKKLHLLIDNIEID